MNKQNSSTIAEIHGVTITREDDPLNRGLLIEYDGRKIFGSWDSNEGSGWTFDLYEPENEDQISMQSGWSPFFSNFFPRFNRSELNDVAKAIWNAAMNIKSTGSAKDSYLGV